MKKKELYYKEYHLFKGTFDLVLSSIILMIPIFNVYIVYGLSKDEGKPCNTFSEFINMVAWKRCKTKEELKWQ